MQPGEPGGRGICICAIVGADRQGVCCARRPRRSPLANADAPTTNRGRCHLANAVVQNGERRAVSLNGRAVSFCARISVVVTANDRARPYGA